MYIYLPCPYYSKGLFEKSDFKIGGVGGKIENGGRIAEREWRETRVEV
jgi:hypothetical protein